MPLYTYTCTKCDHSFEEITTVDEGKKRLKSRCPKCRSKIIRPISGRSPAIHIRGYSPGHPRFFRGMRGPVKKREKK
jgi:putative FmdB family regulatory protein